jgi:hypothetical protein
MAALGKYLVLFGLAGVVCGLMIWCASALPIFDRLGRLPGDIYVRRGNVTFYFPIVTSIVISIVLSLLFSLLRR